jgi:DNA ligase 1
MKPLLACDVNLDKLNYPVMVFAKIDGVRALNVDGRLVGRSGKQFKNELNTEFFSDSRFTGFDGEMVVDRITGFGICNETTSALTTIRGSINTRWCLFDYVLDGANNEHSYLDRYKLLIDVVSELYRKDPLLMRRLWVVPFQTAHNREDLERIELEKLEQGYEGLVIRDPNARYKYGRSTVNEGIFLRLKRFVDTEIEITHVVEGKTNRNELKSTPNGYAERSTVSENMVPNGMIGTICGRAIETVKLGEHVVLFKGQEVEVGPGKMAHNDRKYYFENQNEIIGKIGKFQFFPIGVKDKPRFPTFQGFRDPVDL